MKKFLSILGAAALAFTMTGERADALMTTVGEFNLSTFDCSGALNADASCTGQFDSTATLPTFPSPTGTPPDLSDIADPNTNFDNFWMTQGSYEYVDNVVEPGTANSPTLGSWYESGDVGNSYAAAYQYAVAFAELYFTPAGTDNTEPFNAALNQVLQDASAAGTLPLTFVFPYQLAGPSSILGWAVIVETLANGGVKSVDVTEAGFDKFTDVVNTGDGEKTGTLFYATLNEPDNFPDPVPEIDGPVLVQVGFALMGLYVLMLGRRRREDEGDLI